MASVHEAEAPGKLFMFVRTTRVLHVQMRCEGLQHRNLPEGFPVKTSLNGKRVRDSVRIVWLRIVLPCSSSSSRDRDIDPEAV